VNAAPSAVAPPAFVINLDRAPERRAFMERHCRARGFEVRRVAAIDSRALSPDEIDRHRIRTGKARPLSDDEVACFESHKKAWRMFLDSREPWALVLEDDVYLAADAAPKAARLAATGVAPVVKLNAYVRGIAVNARPLWTGDGHRLLAPAQKTIDGSAYLISREAAAAALARFDRYAEALDLALFDPENGIGVAQVAPALAVQQKYASFPFLEGAAQESALEGGRAGVRSVARQERGHRTPGAIVAAEAGRFFRRRIQPRLLWLTNRFRPAEQRLAHVLIAFPHPHPGALPEATDF
jgi:glycosyl transferase family 25